VGPVSTRTRRAVHETFPALFPETFGVDRDDNRDVPNIALTAARELYDARSWREAWAALAGIDQREPLTPEDLELLGRSAYMIGQDRDYVAALERAHQLYLERGDVPPAVRCSFWIGESLLNQGQGARAGGWFEVGGRLLDEDDLDCVERGYLMIPTWLFQMARGDWEAGLATAVDAAAIGERFGDQDLVWLARDEQCRALVKLGRLDEGIRLVNEALVVVTSGILSPVVSGIVYCNTIIFCRDAFEFRQTREWTEALTHWCDEQPQMVAHNGLCLVHRAEIMQLSGDWATAMKEAEKASEQFTAGVRNQIATGMAHYRQGEIHRLQGRLDAAEDAYREANRCGHEPQPGRALLRLSQGHTDSAASTIRRAVTEHTHPLERAALLPAFVEIMLADGDLDAANAACDELAQIGQRHSTDAIVAMAAYARGAVALAEGDAEQGLIEARRSWRVWHGLGAPYEAARARLLVAEACRLLGDEDSEHMELEAAHAVFADVAAELALVGTRTHPGDGGLSVRELDVLRLVADGLGNREIATSLVISQHTVARHLQNIFAKLGVSSRTAAVAYAHEHRLVRRQWSKPAITADHSWPFRAMPAVRLASYRHGKRSAASRMIKGDSHVCRRPAHVQRSRNSVPARSAPDQRRRSTGRDSCPAVLPGDGWLRSGLPMGVRIRRGCPAFR